MCGLFIAPVNFGNISLLKKIYSELLEIFSCDIKIIDLALDHKAAFSPERNQYYSSKLIADSLLLTGEYDGKVVLLSEFDLFIPIFTFIFGEAQLNGKHSIVSLCRLHEEFYTGKTNELILLERTLKEILHELGHNFGLKHCSSWECVMHASTSIEEVDIKGSTYCDLCKKSVSGLRN